MPPRTPAPSADSHRLTWFAAVTSIAIDERGHVVVADFYNHRMQKFHADKTFSTSFGSNGSGPGQFLYPVALAPARGTRRFPTRSSSAVAV